MSAPTAVQPPIIIKKKVAAHGHHGGAWKVAYADFVTAMMALFIVLWLMNTAEPVKQAVSGYFRDPSGKSAKMGSGSAGSGAGIALGKADMENLKAKLDAALRQAPELNALKDQVQMTVTGEGLRIELLESDQRTFFESGNALPTEAGKEVIQTLAAELKKLRNGVAAEGHTDASPFTGKGLYTNWELSTDRANAARRLLEQSGLPQSQITEVRGFADRHLRKPDKPLDTSNRRISLIVRWEQNPPIDGTEARPKPVAAAPSTHH